MELDLSNLPASAERLITVIGLPAMLRLVDRFGGRTIQLYNSDNSIQQMTELIGKEAAVALLKFYGTAPFTVPKCHSALISARNANIQAEFDRLTLEEKLSARESVARITRFFTPFLHERTIWRILKRSSIPKPIDPRQMSLL